MSVSKKNNFLKDTFFLGFSLALNNFFPLLLIPFFTKIFGIEFYGNFAISSAIISYVILISDYGFNLGALRHSSLNKNRIKFLFSGVFACRLYITIFLLFILFFYLFFIGDNKNIIFFMCFLSVTALFNAVSCQWIFVSLEKLKDYALLSFLSKIPSLAFVFILIYKREEWLALLIAVMPSIMLNILCCIYIKIKLNINLNYKFFRKRYLIILFGYNKNYFFASAGGALFNNVNVILSGIFFGPVQAGYYGIAEKIIKVVIFINAPITQLIFSKIAKNIKNIEKVRIILRKAFFLQGGGMFLISFIFYFFVNYFLEKNIFSIDEEIYLILSVVAFVPFFTALSDIFGNNIMLNYGMTGTFSKLFILCGLFNILFIVFFSFENNYIVVAYGFLFSEFLLCMSRAFFVLRHKSNLIFK